jgi:hypothetical protein
MIEQPFSPSLLPPPSQILTPITVGITTSAAVVAHLAHGNRCVKKMTHQNKKNNSVVSTASFQLKRTVGS